MNHISGATASSQRYGGRRHPHAGFAVAALLGTVHAAFSFYWAVGGRWLIETLGERIVTTFASMTWVLIPVGLVKLAAAALPAWWDARGWPAAHLSRTLCWLGAAVLIGWGGVNTLVAHLVLSGAFHPDGGYDRPGMMGHAWLWDPLFLAWGTAVVLGLVGSRRRSR